MATARPVDWLRLDLAQRAVTGAQRMLRAPLEDPAVLSDELTKLAELRDRGVLDEQEFAKAKARALAGEVSPSPAVAGLNRLRRSNGDRWLGGVCGGIARLTGVESWIWRLLFVVFALFGGAGVLVYLLLWLLVPGEA